MKIDIKVYLNTEVIDKVIEYPSQKKVSFFIDPKDKKINIEKITINGIETNIFYNTRFAIDNSNIVLTSIHEFSKKGIYTIELDDLYILSHRSNNWHCSTYKKDFIFQYEFTHDSFVDTYRDREHIGFARPFIPCFGCSFTFGAHQPAEVAWPSLLRQKTGKNYINLGVGGSGIDGIYNNLTLLHQKYKFNKCVILFPGFDRRTVRAKIENMYFRTHSSINLQETNSDYHFYRNKKLISKMEKVRKSIAKDSEGKYSKIFLRKIIRYCKDNKINLSCSSWNNEVYSHLQVQDNIKLLPKFPRLELFKERADDHQHPHRKHYQYFIDSFQVSIA